MDIRSATFVCLISASTASAADYSRDIQPLFAEHCLECHGPDDSKGGLVLTSREAVLKELKSGAKGIVPGDVAASSLIERVTTTDLEDRMPPKAKKPLKASEVELLKAWIKDGAKFDQHWAYKPVMKFQVSGSKPDASQAALDGKLETFNLKLGTNEHPIDTFVHAKLAEKKIAPSPEADRHTLDQARAL
jgi:mono/diheme cytochrome c family protein